MFQCALWQRLLPGNVSEFVTTIPGRDQYYVQYEVRLTAFNMFGVGRPSPVQYIHSADDSEFSMGYITLINSKSRLIILCDNMMDALV